jgi:hypothetical protein
MNDEIKIIAKKWGLEEEVIAKAFKKVEQEYEDSERKRKQAYIAYKDADKIFQEAYDRKILMQQEIEKSRKILMQKEIEKK